MTGNSSFGMTRLFIDSSLALAAALAVTTGCSTMSRTEKQLAKVDSFDFPDIPSIGNLPPVRPRHAGLAYSSNTLIISYDDGIGNGPLRKALSKYGAEIIYDYSIINAFAIRIPEGKTLEETAKYFRKVKGVVDVSKNAAYRQD